MLSAPFIINKRLARRPNAAVASFEHAEEPFFNEMNPAQNVFVQ